jgi:hypothetical protein
LTIESAYYPIRKTVYTGTFYGFGHEALSGSIEVYRGDGDPIEWTLVDPADYVIQQGGEEPIRLRGNITLHAPISPSLLEIRRFTPRTQLLELPHKEAFPSDAFDFALDKITLICQEIEGSKCWCPNDDNTDWTPEDPEEPPPEPPGEVYECDAYTTAISSVGTFDGHWEMGDKVGDANWPATLKAKVGQNLPVNNSAAGITPETEPIMEDSCANVTCMTIQQGAGAQGFNADIYASVSMTVSAVMLGSDGNSDNIANISYGTSTGGAYQALMFYDFNLGRVGFQYPGNGSVARTQWFAAPTLTDGEAHAITWFLDFALNSDVNQSKIWVDHVLVADAAYDDTTTGITLSGVNNMDLFDSCNTKAMQLAVGGALSEPDVVILKDGWDRNKADYVP